MNKQKVSISLVFILFLSLAALLFAALIFDKKQATEVCELGETAVCGADGETYDNKCEANAVEVETTCDGECPCDVSVADTVSTIQTLNPTTGNFTQGEEKLIDVVARPQANGYNTIFVSMTVANAEILGFNPEDSLVAFKYCNGIADPNVTGENFFEGNQVCATVGQPADFTNGQLLGKLRIRLNSLGTVSIARNENYENASESQTSILQPGLAGQYTVTGPPVCGNSTVEQGEQCDNGQSNLLTCDPQYGGTCSYCDRNTCQNVSVTGPYCGDNNINGPETCDDANAINNDQCSNDCLNTCTSPLIWSGTECVDPSTIAVCGNNIQETGEACEDGNLTPGDGCGPQCQIEPANQIYCGPMDVPTSTFPQGDGKLSLVDFADFVKSYGKTCYDSALTTGCRGKNTNPQVDNTISLLDFRSFVERYGLNSCVI